jgi:S1-C subfamily serine protease
VAATLAAIALYGVFTPAPRPLTMSDVKQGIASALASQTPAPAFSQLVYQAVAPSVVVIQAVGAGESESAAPSMPAIPAASAGPSATAGPSAAPSPGAGKEAVGSGVIVDTAGDILTCLHVISGATAIQVTFADGSTSPAQVTATQPENDIAVLKPDSLPQNFQPAVLGNPRSVQVGSEAYVVGNPFGLDDSMSAGVVSALNRSFKLPNGTTLTGLIQVDAAVNPGNSGGPLVNRYGQVVGIVSGLVNPTDQAVFIGIGLAVPIDVAGGAAGLPQY